jgi:hypothetical protein
MKTSTVLNALQATHGVTFAKVFIETQVKTAAAHKDVSIIKESEFGAMFCGHHKDASALYVNKVGKTSNTSPQDFVLTETWHEHDKQCHAIVYSKSTQESYLYCVVNDKVKSASKYFINGIPSTKQQVAKYLTKSAAELLLNPPGVSSQQD